MKRFLKIFIPLLILGAIVYQFRAGLSAQFLPLWDNLGSSIFPQAPCSEPIPYTLDTFDTQFGISKDYFLSALLDAEAIWEKPFGKQFFNYAPMDSAPNVLKINLIYDYRQQATSKLASLGITVENTKTSYNTLKTKYAALTTEYNTEKNNFNAQVAVFNQQQQAYEAEVNSWNDQGGAPQTEYNKLQAEKSSLDTQSSQLQMEQNQINGMVTEINSMVVVLNRLADTLNLSVDTYNTVGSSPSESFEEGVYTSDGVNRYINVYEFSNRDKLVRVLAHELGHALGLEHVADPKSIMYKINQSDSLILSQDDINELKLKCGIK